MKRILAILTLFAGLSADAYQRPRLVVLVSVDQLRYDYLTRFGRFLPEGGLRRLVTEGASFTDAHYRYANTYTGPGHATQLTGAYSHRTGIVGNRFYDEERGTMIQPCDDARTHLTGCTDERGGASPRQLEASTVGDELKLASPASRVVAISMKDRASILLGGRQGSAVWFDRSIGRWVSSTWYGDQLVEWASDLNTRALPDRDFGKTWDREGPDEAYALVAADDVPWETPYSGLGRTFPRKVVGLSSKRDESFYRAWSATPFAVAAMFEIVKAAIRAEKLGADDTPDLLAIGLSPFDYLGHAYGPHSHEMVSMFFATDRFVRDLIPLLDSAAGPGGWVIALTADHGVAAVPEYLESKGLDAGRVFPEALTGAVDEALAKRWGRGPWIVGSKPPWLWLDKDLIKRRRLTEAEVQDAAAKAIEGMEGIARVYVRHRLERGHYVHTSLTRAVENAFHPQRAGDVYALPRPNWVWGYKGQRHGTGHSTPYRYDTHVPLVLAGPAIKPGTYATPVELIDLAPTLSHLLRLTLPSQSEGRVLHEALSP